MSEDRPIVAPPPRRNADGTTTVTTLDAGDIRLVCPDWCIVEHGYLHPPAKVDIFHASNPVWALLSTPEQGDVSVGPVCLKQWPYSGRVDVFVMVEMDTEGYPVGPMGARRFARAFRHYADHIDAMADKLEAIRAGENQ
ncbi:hypothetical protein ABZS83_05165 [Streptomyces sp. NPDC005426]|uniref:DUF6907 domain-containing protein n=1 Tax=Streptomyces sp. NPDC005426 TaxID=3155344 RepID=UPI0033B18A3A